MALQIAFATPEGWNDRFGPNFLHVVFFMQMTGSLKKNQLSALSGALYLTPPRDPSHSNIHLAIYLMMTCIVIDLTIRTERQNVVQSRGGNQERINGIYKRRLKRSSPLIRIRSSKCCPLLPFKMRWSIGHLSNYYDIYRI